MSDPDAIRRAVNHCALPHASLLILSSTRAAGEAVARELVEGAGDERRWQCARRHGQSVVLDEKGVSLGVVLTTETAIRGKRATVVLDVISTEEMRESARIALGPGTGARWITYTGSLAALARRRS